VLVEGLVAVSIGTFIVLQPRYVAAGISVQLTVSRTIRPAPSLR